jgi:hypothetical protein
MAEKSWYQQPFYQAIVYLLLALVIGADLIQSFHGHKVVWMEVVKLAVLLGSFAKQLLLARKHPESEVYIFDAFSFAAITSAMTDAMWAFYIA